MFFWIIKGLVCLFLLFWYCVTISCLSTFDLYCLLDLFVLSLLLWSYISLDLPYFGHEFWAFISQFESVIVSYDWGTWINICSVLGKHNAAHLLVETRLLSFSFASVCLNALYNTKDLTQEGN